MFTKLLFTNPQHFTKHFIFCAQRRVFTLYCHRVWCYFCVSFVVFVVVLQDAEYPDQLRCVYLWLSNVIFINA